MRTGLGPAVGAAIAAVIVAGSAIVAAPGQQGSERPGQIVPGTLFIGNRPGTNEAVPVVLEAVTARTPVGVSIVGTPAVTIPPTNVVAVRAAFQAWDYRTLTVPAAQDPATAVSALGGQGWELAGVLPASSGSILLLKRPR